MLRIIDIFTPVKVEKMGEEIGLDESIHGEHAYETLEVEDLFNDDRKLHASDPKPEEEPELVGPRK